MVKAGVIVCLFLFFLGGCTAVNEAPGKTLKPNRLIHEKSPYLLQHAYNPVDWYPWGEEAFAKARSEDKPIFLSIGYSTCHWCHVMERESFSDGEVAELMNRYFVSIKLDREERPDVDQLYMQAVLSMTGQGGWPLSIFLTPDLKPFFGGTYFPPEGRWGQPGFKQILKGVADAWANRRGELITSSEELTRALQAQEKAKEPGALLVTSDLLRGAHQILSASFDERFGGFGSAPKFPRSHTLSLLIRIFKRNKDPQALRMVEETLTQMHRGGMFDQLGGGFHRYSTDSQWRVPHFEKMLYDQALLSKTYLEVYQATAQEEFAAAAKEIFEYVLYDLSGKEGAFYSAEDADSVIDPAHPEEKGEGAFYVWEKRQIDELLGQEKAKPFHFLWGVLPNGNALSDPTGEFKGKNILFSAHTIPEAAKEFGLKEEEVQALLAKARKILLDARGKRPRPHLDDKILVDWNGLMISSLAFGSRVLEEPRYAQAAERAAEFILEKLIRQDGRLLHRYRDGEAALLGTLEDYAFFIHGLIDLYEATFKPRYLAEAERLTHEMVRLFWDEAQGGFFMTGQDAQRLLVRQKELYDGAIPSGNSVAALDLIRMGRLTMDKELEEKAKVLVRAFSRQIHQNPEAYPQLLIALDFALGPSQEIVIAASPRDPGTQAMVKEVFRPFLPNKVVAFHPMEGEEKDQIEKLVPFLRDQVALQGKPTVYVCQNYACQLPTTDLKELRRQLEKP